MKKTTLILLLVLLFPLGACSAGSGNILSIEHSGQSFVVDRERQEISDGTYLYQYHEEGNGVLIEYPNGATYFNTRNGGLNIDEGRSSAYDDVTYVSGDVLIAVVSDAGASRSYLTAFLIAAAGVFNIVFPKVAWYWGRVLSEKKGEPSKNALLVSRLGGVFIIIVAIVYLFV